MKHTNKLSVCCGRKFNLKSHFRRIGVLSATFMVVKLIFGRIWDNFRLPHKHTYLPTSKYRIHHLTPEIALTQCCFNFIVPFAVLLILSFRRSQQVHQRPYLKNHSASDVLEIVRSFVAQIFFLKIASNSPVCTTMRSLTKVCFKINA